MNYKSFEELPCWNKASEYLQKRGNSNSQFGEAYELAAECRKQIKGFRKYLRDYDSSDRT
jgi:hypothetical protein